MDKYLLQITIITLKIIVIISLVYIFNIKKTKSNIKE